MKKISLMLLTFLASALMACGRYEGENTRTDGVILELAVLEKNRELQKQVENFNNSQKEVSIVINEYESIQLEGEDGLSLIKREIAMGKGPDIIDFGTNYSKSAIVDEYTEDLYAYMGNVVLNEK